MRVAGNPKPKILKLDYVHPEAYLEEKKRTTSEIPNLSREKYLEWVLGLRANFSDYFTHAFSKLGCEAQEYLLFDPEYTSLVLKELGDSRLLRRIRLKWKNRNPIDSRNYDFDVLRSYIKEIYKPDIIFVREHSGIPSQWWAEFRDHCKIVSSISCPMPRDWHPKDFDLILTTVPILKDFFELQGVQSAIIRAGFDPRVLQDLNLGPPKHDVCFVGGVSPDIFSQRVQLLETVASRVNLACWGYGFELLGTDSRLRELHRGAIGGLDMYQAFSDSRIVLNDYINMAGGCAVNQRLYEAMGVGSMLLTRESPSLERFPQGIFATFADANDCVKKVEYYLAHEDERNAIAAAGQKYALEHFGYESVASAILELLNGESCRKAA